MNIDAMFPSKYLRAADLNGQRYNMRIKAITSEDVGSEDKPEIKPVMHFDRARKGLVMNKTTAAEVAMAFGKETDAWIGKSVEVYPSVTMFKGQQVACIRLRAVFDGGGGGDGGSLTPPTIHTLPPRVQPSVIGDTNVPFSDEIGDIGNGSDMPF